MFVAVSSISFSGKSSANVRRLWKFANRAPAPHVSRARRRVPLPRRKNLAEVHGNRSESFGVRRPRRRLTQSTTSAHKQREEQKQEGRRWESLRVAKQQNTCNMFLIPYISYCLIAVLSQALVKVSPCMNISSDITKIISVSVLAPTASATIAHAVVEDVDVFPTSLQIIVATILNTEPCYPTSSSLSL